MYQMESPKTFGEFCSEEARYQSLFEGVPIGLYITTQDGRIIDANPTLVQTLGYPSKSALLGIRVSEVYEDPSDREHEHALFEDDHIVQNYETQLRRLDGTLIWVRDTCRAIRSKSGEIQYYEGSLRDITREKESEQRLNHMARHDPLTGAFNRYALAEILKRETSRAKRYDHSIGILMIDINRFKEVNDQHSHAAGDQILKRVAGILSSSIRDTDYVIRYGGDEFLLLLIETKGETQVVRARIAEEMVSLRPEKAIDGFPITLSIGAAHWIPSSNVPMETILADADQAMYADKRRQASLRSSASS
jgi:diguanylate cyclase (GGDEF)-like protein/PAS domain S-box-containing protein